MVHADHEGEPASLRSQLQRYQGACGTIKGGRFSPSPLSTASAGQAYALMKMMTREEMPAVATSGSAPLLELIYGEIGTDKDIQCAVTVNIFYAQMTE